MPKNNKFIETGKKLWVKFVKKITSINLSQLKIFRYLDTNKIAVAAAILLLLTVSFSWLKNFTPNFQLSQSTSNSQANLNITPTETSIKYYNTLNGEEVKSTEDINLLPLGIMVENEASSRPQSGLNHAAIVYEALTEGGISRFLAIFTTGIQTEKIGPVRSSRAYFLDWISEYQGLYMHIGGSPEALNLLSQYHWGAKNVEEFAKTAPIWRDNEKFAPHNAYTSTQLIKDYIGNKEIGNNGDFKPWTFVDEVDFSGLEPETVSQITIPYSNYDYKVVWKYIEQDKNYVRYHDTEPHLDSDGKQITTKNILIQFVDTQVVDDIGRRQMQTIGTGKLLYVVNGQMITGTWKKENRTTRTLFFDDNGQELKSNRGKIWINIVPRGMKIITENNVSTN